MKIPVASHTVLLTTLLFILPLAGQHRSETYSRKSTTTGIALSVVNTALPVALGGRMIHRETNGALAGALFLYGSLLGPSAGNFYAEDTRRGLYGVAMRSLALITSLTATQGGTWDENGSSKEEYVLLGAMLVSVGSAVWNIATVPRSVREYEQRHDNRFSMRPAIHGGSGALTLNFQWRY